MIERRREPRIQANLSLCIWEIDVQSRPFQQEAIATAAGVRSSPRVTRKSSVGT